MLGNIEIKGVANKCRHHQMETRKGNGPHSYRLWCLTCNKHVQWISNRNAHRIVALNNIDK